MLSTNPLSIAFPGAEQPPFVLDMATSVIPLNRIELIKETGGSIPPGWGMDAEGRPTTDPEAIRQLLPLGGTRELGGHKGYGLGTAVTVLCAVLSGAWGPTPAEPPGEGATYSQQREAHFFGAFRLDLFQPPGDFKRALDAMLRALQASPPIPGRERVYVAGEIEHETEQQRRRTGIPLTDKLVADLRDLSETYGIPLELPAGP
jgi:LDH2 family malate/lactate/ureidoglycolate dehydrogenase